jgi:hypothetical protein
LEDQIAACTIRAPTDGIVVHARPDALEPGSPVFVPQMQQFLRVISPSEPRPDRR